MRSIRKSCSITLHPQTFRDGTKRCCPYCGNNFAYLRRKRLPIGFNAIILVAAAIVAIMSFMIVLGFKPQWTLKVINLVTNFAHKITKGKWKLANLKEQAVEITEHFHDAMTEFRHNPKAIGGSLFYLVISWFFSLSIPYLVFMSLGHPVSLSIIIVTSAIFLAVKAIPIGVPFEVGLPEAVMTTLYISMGVYGPLAATATILTRIITLWFRFFIGFGAQQWLELKPAISPRRKHRKN